VSPSRRCSRTACTRTAVATLTYVYADSMAVVGPLAAYVEPHSFDLCTEHADRLTAPLGWEMVRLPTESEERTPSGDDLEALANAVRGAARPDRPDRSGSSGSSGSSGNPGAREEPARHVVEVGRRGHLRVLRSIE
jgi:hypothetical protein